jgi:hypothetical protein
MRFALRSGTWGWDQTNWTANLDTTAWLEVRTAALWLSSAVVIELNRGRNAEALTNLLRMVDLAHNHAGERNFAFQMARTALAGLAFATTWEVLQASGWSDAQLAELQSAWQRVSLLLPIELALQMERAKGLEFFALTRIGEPDDQSMNQLADTFTDALYGPLWNVALAGSDELHFLRAMSATVDALRAARHHSSGAELELRLPKETASGWLAALRFPMARLLTLHIQKPLKRAITREAQRELVLAVIGLERYRLRHGRYPENLGQLTPEILSSVPVDFGDGKPLRYEKTERRYRLWSVWENTHWPEGKSAERE